MIYMIRFRYVSSYIIFLLILLINGVLYYCNRYFQLDDALIYYRYVENAIQGRGLIYNPGVYFNGLTSPLYTYLSLAFAWFIKDIQTSQVVLNFLLSSMWAIVTVLFLQSKAEKVFLFLVPCFVITQSYFSKVLGLETHLFILLCVSTLYFYERRKYFILGIISAFLLLTRGESIFLILAILVEHGRSQRPLPRLNTFIMPAMILVFNYLFNFYYYGSLLPDTFTAKIQQGNSGLWPPFYEVGYHIGWFFGGKFILAGLQLLLAFVGFISLRKTPLFRISSLYLVLYTAFYVFLKIPNYHWYYSMYYFFSSVFVIVALNTFYQWGKGLNIMVSNRLMRSVVLGLSVFVSVAFTRVNLQFVASSGPFGPYQRIGLWMREHLNEDAKVAMIEVGTVGWYSKLYIIDILGLTNPKNAQALGQKAMLDWLKYDAPDFILLHDPPRSKEMTILEWIQKNGYQKAEKFDVPGYLLFKIPES